MTNTYKVLRTYRAIERFTVNAETPEQAARFVTDGDPSDPRVPGDSDYDEYLDVEKIEVMEDGSDEIVFSEGSPD